MAEKQNGRQPLFVPHAFAQAAQRKQNPIVDRDKYVQPLRVWFEPFWFGMGYGFKPFCSEIGYGS